MSICKGCKYFEQCGDANRTEKCDGREIEEDLFKVEIRTGGSAYKDQYTGDYDKAMQETQIAYDLEDVAKRIRDGHRKGTVMDTNGNKVGYWELS